MLTKDRHEILMMPLITILFLHHFLFSSNFGGILQNVANAEQKVKKGFHDWHVDLQNLFSGLSRSSLQDLHFMFIFCFLLSILPSKNRDSMDIFFQALSFPFLSRSHLFCLFLFLFVYVCVCVAAAARLKLYGSEFQLHLNYLFRISTEKTLQFNITTCSPNIFFAYPTLPRVEANKCTNRIGSHLILCFIEIYDPRTANCTIPNTTTMVVIQHLYRLWTCVTTKFGKRMSKILHWTKWN